MADEYHRIYDKRPGGILPFQKDDDVWLRPVLYAFAKCLQGRVVVYPGEIFCRVEVAKGVLCGVQVQAVYPSY
jgi:hypothetical protein